MHNLLGLVSVCAFRRNVLHAWLILHALINSLTDATFIVLSISYFHPQSLHVFILTQDRIFIILFIYAYAIHIWNAPEVNECFLFIIWGIYHVILGKRRYKHTNDSTSGQRNSNCRERVCRLTSCLALYSVRECCCSFALSSLYWR